MEASQRCLLHFRFAGFEFDATTGELWAQSRHLPLPEQAGKVLFALLTANGEMVSRDALKKVLWPDKAYGDLEGGLNTAVAKLRQVLDDDGAEPRLVGTLPKRGYRLLVPAERIEPPVIQQINEYPEAPGASPVLPRDGPGQQQQASAHSHSARRAFWKPVAILACLVALGLAGFLGYRLPAIPIGRIPGGTWKDTQSGLEFGWVPPGVFLMGSQPGEQGRNTDENQHQVTISKGFWLGRYEVTQGQYEAVLGANPSHFTEGGLQAPVENVNWEDAQTFLQKLNTRVRGRSYRLPTEAEWEYACRAGTTGSAYSPLGAIAWNAYTSGLKTHPVGQKLANAWGLYDMLGNVYEWCQDCYKDPYDVSLDTDPVGPPSNRYHVIRGGSWQSGTTQSRAAYRSSEATFELRYPFTGFRVACSPIAMKK